MYHVCPPVLKIIHSLKLVDYLHVQADKIHGITITYILQMSIWSIFSVAEQAEVKSYMTVTTEYRFIHDVVDLITVQKNLHYYTRYRCYSSLHFYQNKIS